MKKRWLSAVLSILMVISILPLHAMTAASASAPSRDDVVQWMNSNRYTTINDGGTQCVAVFNSYLRLFGISSPISNYPVFCAAEIFDYNAPDGWQKIAGSGNYQVGDIVLWNYSPYGHVGIVYSVSGSDVQIFDQNYDGRAYCDVHVIHSTGSICGVFRPALSGGTPATPTITFSKWEDAAYTGIWETRASLGVHLSESNCRADTIGMSLWDYNDILVGNSKTYSTEVSSTNRNYYIETDADFNKYQLVPGKTYSYQFFAIAGGQYYYGPKWSFKTEGTDTYKIAYDANGGTGAPSVQYKDHGKDLILSSVQPTRDGYVFLGWSTDSKASSATYFAGGTYIANASVTLYAVWMLDGPHVTVTRTLFTTTPTKPVSFLGDANRDGSVDMKDVLLVRKCIANMNVTISRVAADVNGDGGVDMKDVLLIRKFIAKMISHF